MVPGGRAERRRARGTAFDLLPLHPTPRLVLEVLLEVADSGLARDGGTILVKEVFELVSEAVYLVFELLWGH